MNEDQLVALIDDKISKGIGSESGEITEKRLTAYDYYMGENYGDERTGRSSVVTREVLETVEWAMPSLVRIFLSGNAPVEFTPVGPDDETQAEHETRVLQGYLSNDRFEPLHDWIKSCLFNPNGYVKVYADQETETTVERLSGLTEIQLTELLSKDGVEPLAHEAAIQEIEGVPVELHDVEVRYTRRKPLFKIEACPEEEVIVDDDHTTLDLDKSVFVCHRSKKRATDLIEMGYPRDLVDSLSDEDGPEFSEERINRREDEDSWGEADDAGEMDRSMRELWFEESYLLVDYDGDGIAERRCVKKVGKTVLDNDEINYMPMVAMTSILMPHRHTGLPLAELAMIWQRVSSTLMRQLLDNSYRVNNPRPVYGRGVDLDDLMTDIPNKPIYAEDVNQLRMEPTQPIVDHLLPTLDLVDQRRESITGVSRHQKGLDAETLAQTTKGAFLGAIQAANQRIEMIARVFAQTGFRKVYSKLHQLMRQYQDVGYQTKIAGKWVDVNPAEWRERTNVRVSVGTGNASIEEKTLAANAILQLQERIVSAGGMGVLVTEQHIFNAAEELVEASGKNDAERFFRNPANSEPLPQTDEPSPEDKLLAVQAEIEQMKAQLQQQKTQMDFAIKARDLQRREEELQHKINKEKAELELEYATSIPGGYA